MRALRVLIIEDETLIALLFEEVLVRPEYRTGDLGGKANTIQCGKAIADAIS